MLSPLLAFAVVGLAAWLAYLAFILVFVRMTGDPAHLKHAAAAVRAFRGAIPLAAAEIVKAWIASKKG